jgi:hypothetical protein
MARAVVDESEAVPGYPMIMEPEPRDEEEFKVGALAYVMYLCMHVLMLHEFVP